MTKDVEIYLYRVKDAFPVFNETEKRFYNDFKSSVLEYTESNPACTLEELQETFGAPTDIAIDYFNNTDSVVYFTLMERAKYIKTAVTAFLLFLFLALGITAFYYSHAIEIWNNELADHAKSKITGTSITNDYYLKLEDVHK